MLKVGMPIFFVRGMSSSQIIQDFDVRLCDSLLHTIGMQTSELSVLNPRKQFFWIRYKVPIGMIQAYNVNSLF